MRPSWRATLLLGLVATLAAPVVVQAANREYTARAHDLAVVVDTRWAGCRYGGYYPIRIRLTNTGPARNLTFRFSSRGYGERMPDVVRVIGAEQNATVQFSLSIPMAGTGNYGTLAILDRGQVLKGLQWDVSLADVVYNEPHRPSLLVISGGSVNADAFETAVRSMFLSRVPSGSYYGTPSIQPDHESIPPTLLPDSWIGYSGLDLVAIPLDTLAGLGTAPRSALLQWVQTGGTLIVTKVGSPAEGSEPLRRALGLDGQSSAGDPWTGADLSRRKAPTIWPEQAATSTLNLFGESEQPEMPKMPEGEAFLWPQRDTAFQVRPMLLGRVVAIPGDPFSVAKSDGAAPGDWLWILSTLDDKDLVWESRHGMSTRMGHREFLNFEIPGLRGVPVPAFLVLMTLFAILIGPVNYFVLWRRRQLWLLVVTIPAVAFVTSVSLFGYSTISHGFGVKSRTRSFTVLDQRSHAAVTTARISLFAGLAPSKGLRFSPETAVYPVWSNSGQPFQPGNVDWTVAQDLDSGWLRSRTRTQLLTVTHRAERGRLVIGTPDEGRIGVENGFAWDIEGIVVSGRDGRHYVGSEIPKGASKTLRASDSADDFADVLTMLRRHPPQLPAGAENFTASGYGYGYGYHRYAYSPYSMSYDQMISFANSRMERTMVELGRLPAGSALPPGTYLVVFRENPGVQTGLDRTREQAPLHVLLGHY